VSKIITGKNIVKTFGTGAEQAKALNGVNAEIEKGEFVAVMGPSGSGKSTLLFALSGMDDITSGSVKFGDTELSKALSEQLGRDVYHYHLHVIYIPVVDCEVKWTTRCKDPALVGTVKEVIKQVSNSKKWASPKKLDEQGRPVLNKKRKPVLIPSYSLLQDRFYEHMLAAGYDDIERGERGSTAEHLDVLDFKIQQDSQRLNTIQQDIQSKQKQSDMLNKRLAVKQNAAITYHDIDGLARQDRQDDSGA